jgi:uncharacterized protein (TIGR00251 family)
MKIERIKLLVKPGASRNSVEGFHQDRIKIKIIGIPERGKANKELVSFIAKKLCIPKNSIAIISGENSNLKEIEVKKDTDEDIASVLLKN